jgi:hypothetical protein
MQQHCSHLAYSLNCTSLCAYYILYAICFMLSIYAIYYMLYAKYIRYILYAIYTAYRVFEVKQAGVLPQHLSIEGVLVHRAFAHVLP